MAESFNPVEAPDSADSSQQAIFGRKIASPVLRVSRDYDQYGTPRMTAHPPGSLLFSKNDAPPLFSDKATAETIGQATQPSSRRAPRHPVIRENPSIFDERPAVAKKKLTVKLKKTQKKKPRQIHSAHGRTHRPREDTRRQSTKAQDAPGQRSFIQTALSDSRRHGRLKTESDPENVTFNIDQE